MATDRNGRTIAVEDDYVLVARVVGIVDDTCVVVDTGRAQVRLDASRIAYVDQLGGGGGGGATTLGALTDVSVPSPSSGQLLRFNGSLWVAVDHDLDDLADVSAGSPSSDQVLSWNGSAWAPRTLPVPMQADNNLSELTDASAARTNLGLGDAATRNVGTGSGDVAAGDHGHVVAISLGDLDDVTLGFLGGGELLRWNGSAWEGYVQPAYAALTHSHTLADVSDAGDSASRDVGTGSGDVAAGDHGHADLDALQADGAIAWGHRHARTEDFLNFDDWSGLGAGSGVHTVIGPQQISWLADVGGRGFARVTNGGGTASTDYRYIRGNDLNAYRMEVDASAAEWIVAFRCGVTHSSSIRCWVGAFSDNRIPTAAQPGYSFEFDSAQTNIQCRTYDGTTTTDVDSGVTLASFAQAMKWCVLRMSSAGCTFEIDGSVVATQTTDLPTGADARVYEQAGAEGNGATWRSLCIDRISVDYDASIGTEHVIG